MILVIMFNAWRFAIDINGSRTREVGDRHMGSF
jgi:hypothetical protein